jgi:nitroreductase
MDGATSPVNAKRRSLSVEDAIVGRQSIRAFKADPVPQDILREVLRIASRAPSGSNIQPWRVWVATGTARHSLAEELTALYDAGAEEKRTYDYYPVKWFEPYLSRRRACGWGLYNTMGITRDDKTGMHDQRRQNYTMFGAPAAFFFAIDKDLELGSWLDYGMFLQSIMIAARDFGLETIAQAALANYPDVVKRRLGIPEDLTLICGMSIGYPDTEAKVNSFRTEREPVDAFTTWVEQAQG